MNSGIEKEDLISELADKILETLKNYGEERHTTLEIDVSAMLVVLNKMYSYIILRNPGVEYDIKKLYSMKNAFNFLMDEIISNTIQRSNSSKAEAEGLR